MATEIIPPSATPVLHAFEQQQQPAQQQQQQSQQNHQQKVSRYRSVRRAQQEQQIQIQQLDQSRQQQQQQQQQHSSPPRAPPMPPIPTVPDMQPHKDAPISRSMSRYHRRPTVSHATTPKPPTVPAPSSSAAQAQQSPPPQAQLSLPTPTRNRAVSSPQHAPHAANTGQHRPRTARHASADPRPRGDDSARVFMQKERERQRVLKEKYDAEAREKREAKQAELNRQETLRLLEEESAQRKAQQELDDAEALRRQKEELRAERERGKRLQKAEAQKALQQREEEVRRAKQEDRDRRAVQMQEHAARKAQAPSSPPSSPPRQDVGFGLFKRRKDAALYPDGAPKMSSPPRLPSNHDAPEPETIRPGGGGAVLGIDAPTSAVNAGDRRVTVVCNKKHIQLSVTPTTTPLDLIKTAAIVLTDPIDVRTAVISELFAKVSITRPLRNYEYVRDVMNSWDYDTQNELTIIDSDVDGINQDDLLSYKVSETRPEGMSCFIQYSSRPGKWSKRYMTLRPDGQLVMAKNEKAKEKDQENICTLTDYDIYSITQQKLARVKPPKKICYAVKSMQKSNIFADESQYVHFFCTNDRGTATIFYQAIQRWRSWYLKHQKGEGLKKKAPVAAVRNVSGGEASQIQPSHARGESVGSHYQLGAFKPLLDMNDFNKALDEIEVHRPGEFPDDKPLAKLDTQAMHARKRSVRVKQPPPAAFSRSALAPEATSQPLGRSGSVRRSADQQEDDTFASGGLLGRAYTQRQAAVQAREQESAGPFIEGPSLLNSMSRITQASTNDSGLSRSASTRSTQQRTSNELKRSASKRIPGMPQPLVDLTPSYQPPPQFASKGRGRGYNPGTAPGPLVESATSPEEAIKVPPSTDWRARSGTSRAAHGTYGTGGHERTRSLKGRGEPLAAYTQNNHSGAPEDDSNAFTGGGLVSTAGFSQGHAPVGRGVMDGSKAKGPMLDFKDDQQFASGSLLSTLPSTSEPTIDRSGK